jgi:hypothetical protein
VISFAILIFAWRKPQFNYIGGHPLPGLTKSSTDRPDRRPRAGLRHVRLGGIGHDGRPRSVDQPDLRLPVGLDGGRPSAISLLLGQFRRATKPLRTIHRGLCAVARIDAEQGLVTLPAGMGWPAAVGLFGFGWLELVQPDRTTLPVFAALLAWLVILILGAPPSWRERSRPHASAG